MKSLELKKETHQRLEAAFKEWLSLTGYAESTVYGMPLYIREFLHWLEAEELSIEKLTPDDLYRYFFHLERRGKKVKTGALSVNYLLKHLGAIKRFSHYLRVTEQETFEVDLTLPEHKRKMPQILTRAEINEIYEITESSPLGLRDRAMLAVFYGCGLRQNEGVSLDCSDFLKDQNLLYVRKGKLYKERYVPLTAEVKQDIESYLFYGRNMFLKKGYQEALFLSERGERIQGQSLRIRLKKLAGKAEISKEVTLHALRHSIATHLLESGMSLPNIARFLGHDSLESTQIYTHILNEL